MKYSKSYNAKRPGFSYEPAITMNAYKTYVEVDSAGRVVLEDLPFRKGSLVEVLVVDQSPEAGEVESWRALFKHIQSLPQSQSITDEDIAKEIDDFRSGR